MPIAFAPTGSGHLVTDVVHPRTDFPQDGWLGAGIVNRVPLGAPAIVQLTESYRTTTPPPRPSVSVQRHLTWPERSTVATNPTFDPTQVAAPIDSLMRSGFHWELRHPAQRDRYRSTTFIGAAQVDAFYETGGLLRDSFRVPASRSLGSRRLANLLPTLQPPVVPFDPTTGTAPLYDPRSYRMPSRDAMPRVVPGDQPSLDIYVTGFWPAWDAQTKAYRVADRDRMPRIVPGDQPSLTTYVTGFWPAWDFQTKAYRVAERLALWRDRYRTLPLQGAAIADPVALASLILGTRTVASPRLDLLRHLTRLEGSWAATFVAPSFSTDQVAPMETLFRTFRTAMRAFLDTRQTDVAGSLIPAPLSQANLFPRLYGDRTAPPSFLDRVRHLADLLPSYSQTFPFSTTATVAPIDALIRSFRVNMRRTLDTRPTEVAGSLTPAPLYPANLFPRLHGERGPGARLLDLWRHLADVAPSYSQTFPFTTTSVVGPASFAWASFRREPRRATLRPSDLTGSMMDGVIAQLDAQTAVTLSLRMAARSLLDVRARVPELLAPTAATLSTFLLAQTAPTEALMRAAFRVDARRALRVWPGQDSTEIAGSLTPAPLSRAELFPRLYGERTGKRPDERRWDVPPMLWREQAVTFDVTTTTAALDELWRSYLALSRPRLGVLTDRHVQALAGSLTPAPLYQANLYAAVRILDLRTSMRRALGVLADRDMPAFMGSLTPAPLYRAEIFPRIYGELPSIRRILDLLRHTTDVNPSYSRTIPFDPTITVGSIDELIRSLRAERHPVLDTRQTLVDGSRVPAPIYQANLYTAVKIWDEWARGRKPLDPRDYEVKQVLVPVPVVDLRTVIAALDLLTRSVRAPRGPILDPRDYEIKKVLVPAPIVDPTFVTPALDLLLRSFRANPRRKILPGQYEDLEPQASSLTPSPVFPGSLYAGVNIPDRRVLAPPRLLLWEPADLTRVRDVPVGVDPALVVAAIRELESFRVAAPRSLGWADLIGAAELIIRFFYPISGTPVFVSGGDDRFGELLGGGSQALIIVGGDDRVVQANRSGGP